MAILTVGVSQQFSTIAAAVAAAKAGDTVQIQAGTYTNDFPHVTSAITIEGVGGIVHLVATVPPPDGKSIMTVDASATIRNLDFSGAKVADNNGAGIRYEAGDLVIQNCSFHDNQDGLLGNPVPGGTITIDGSTFTHNGIGDGYTHNLYVGDIASLTVTNSIFTDAVVGHEIKSRAETNIIKNNVISDGPSGTASYSIDLPNGGNALIEGNTIEKGPHSENPTVIHFGGEGIPYANSQLTITGNTITNDLTARPATLLTNATLSDAIISGNTLLGVPFGTYSNGPATLTGNTEDGRAVPDSVITNSGGGGNVILFNDSLPHNVTLTSGQAVQGSAGLLTATGAGHDTVVGGSGGLVWTGQGGADSITTKAGSSNSIKLGLVGNTVDSEGTDVIKGTTGNDTYTIDGRATVQGSTGNSGYAVNGSAVIAAHGVDTVALGASATAQITAAEYVTLTSNGGTFSLSVQEPGKTVLDTVSVSGGATSLKAYGSGIFLTTGGGSHGEEIDLGTGTHNITSSGPDTIRAGAGNDTVIVTGRAAIYGGTGNLSVFGRGIVGQATVHGGAGPTTIDGNGGNILFQAGTGATFVEDRLSNVAIVGGAGRLSVNADAFSLTVQGGVGGLTLNDKFGGHTITTAAGARDTLNLVGGSSVTSNGTDEIVQSGGASSTITANGAATVDGSSGNNLFTMNGQDLLLTRSAEIDRTTVGGAANVMMSSMSARDVVSVAGGQLSYFDADFSAKNLLLSQVTIHGHALLDRANGASAAITTQGGAATQITTADAARISSYGSDTISAGAGALSVVVGGRAQVIFGAGGGTLTNDGSATVTGGSGNTTLVGGAASALDFQDGSGQALVQLGAGNGTVRAGAGAMTVQAGAGQELIEVQAGKTHGHELVTGFDASRDSIRLDGYAPGSAHVVAYAGGVQLNLADGTQIQFAGLTRLPGF